MLETRYPEIVQSQPELVAHHYSKAEDDEKAIKYFTAMAEKSAGMSAHAEAVSALENARRHAEHLPAHARAAAVLALTVRQAQSLHFLGHRQQIVDLLAQEQERLPQIQDRSLVAEYYFWLGFAHAWLGHREQALEYLQHSLAEAIAAGDQAIAGRVHRAGDGICLFG